ncbi:nucleoside triphosphate pyrophosphohydrolase [Alicyclobacillus tolerans]|uniref:Tetrapyrrole methylase family protein/MazG family protein n=1 Tax=Alicyclobacillus tolerans TaxID=90970 RepID=A0ABT9LZS1_9BACL|nr:nucleoside triphosphate pyrophosphohydrolase [Alicyclobacillus tengchongensis]MDP9729755.1 tetrapyrrole methylase family protein/MazG family protein [Alicyclobacillus tengchongensis]
MLIEVVGLGPGDESTMPLSTWKTLQESRSPIILRTKIHPSVPALTEAGISFTTFDHLYEQHGDFETLYEQMAEELLRLATQHKKVIYAVPGHPRVAEQSVELLLKKATACGVDVHVGAGQSFLDPLCTAIGLDPIAGLLLLDGTQLHITELQPGVHTLIAQVYSPAVASDVKLTLMEVYPDEHEVTVLSAVGVAGEESVTSVPLYELDRLTEIHHLTTVYVPPVQNLSEKARHPLYLADIVARLRHPLDGCPWDLAQTHETLIPYATEEAYEVAQAILEDDPAHLQEELGDLLLQVLLHAQIAAENGDFTLQDVFFGLAEKLVRRHPHVFGQQSASNAEEAEAMWKSAKAEEKQRDSLSLEGNETPLSRMSDVQTGQDALNYAFDVQKRAAKVGFEWNCIEDVLEKLREEIIEFEEALNQNDSKALTEELGDLFFTLVNLSRWLKMHPEMVLRKAVIKFVRRFERVEQAVHESGRTWQEYRLDELDQLWQNAKL